MGRTKSLLGPRHLLGPRRSVSGFPRGMMATPHKLVKIVIGIMIIAAAYYVITIIALSVILPD
jgi:hypothetical protein